VAGFLTIIIPLSTQAYDEPGASFTMVTQRTQSADVVQAIERFIDSHGIDAVVSVENSSLSPDDPDWITVEIPENESELDTLRTGLWGIPDVSRPASSDGDSWMSYATLDDIRLAGVLVLTVTLIVACISAMVIGVSGILDRRHTFSALRLAGTPL